MIASPMCCIDRLAGGAAMITIAVSTASATGPIEVIYSEVPGHPTALVPGARDLDGNPVFAEFKALEILAMSPDGREWIIKGRNTLGDQLETMLLRGSGTKGTVLAQEGQPIPGGVAGERYDFFGSGQPHFNEVGQFVYTARARGGDPSVKHKGILFDGVELQLVREESDPALGLLDLPRDESGDELFGNSFGAFHLLNDGTIGSHDTTIQNIHSSRRPAVFYGNTAFRQVNVGFIEGILWDGMDLNDFVTTPDGSTWYIQGDDIGPTDRDDILAVNDVVVLREGSAIDGSSVVVDAVFFTRLLANGDWLTRGDDLNDDDWAVRDGVLIAATGDPITTGSGEHWGDAILSFTGTSGGDFVIAGNTDRADPARDSVIVLNGTEVVVREGDMVDLNGDGLPNDDAFIGRGDPALTAFRADDMYLADGGLLYFFASLRDAEGNDLGSFGTGGDAFLRLAVVDCLEDLDDSGAVDFGDILAILAAWGPCP